MTGVGGGTTSSGCGPFLGVKCLGIPCAPGIGCCYPNASMPMCGLITTCMQAGDKYYACDDPTDCGPGLVCCHTTGGGSVCTSAASCTAPNQAELCSSPTAGAPSCECTGGKQCCPTGVKNSLYPTCQTQGGPCL
jgi:hypothetical protein